MQIYGFLEKAQLENVSSDLANTLAGLIWFNTTDSRSRFYDGTAVRTIVDTDSTQTLINKILTGNQIANFTPDGVETITAPVVSGEMTINDATQTLTNKTIQGANFQDPERSDVKKDTRVNLETYALTATDGQVVFATDDKVYYGIKDNKLIGLGGGSGSLDYFYSEDFSLTEAADLQVVGTITVADETADPMSGDKSIKITQVAGSLGAIVKSPLNDEMLDLQKNEKNSECGIKARYRYDGGDNEIDLVVYDETNSEILVRKSIEASDGSTSKKLMFKTEETTAKLSYYFEVKVEIIGAVLEIDNVEMLVNPEVLGNSVQVNSVFLSGNNLEGVSGATNIPWNGTGEGWDSAQRGYIRQHNTSTLLIIGGTSSNANQNEIEMYVDGVFKQRVDTVSASVNQATRHLSVTIPDDVLKGQLISFRITGGGFTLVNDANHYLAITETQNHKQVFYEGESEDTDEIWFNVDASGNITESKYEGNNGVTVSNTGTGTYSIDYSSLGLTVRPTVEVTATRTTGFSNGIMANTTTENVTNTTCPLVVRSASGSQISQPFTVSISKNAPDLKGIQQLSTGANVISEDQEYIVPSNVTVAGDFHTITGVEEGVDYYLHMNTRMTDNQTQYVLAKDGLGFVYGGTFQSIASVNLALSNSVMIPITATSNEIIFEYSGSGTLFGDGSRDPQTGSWFYLSKRNKGNFIGNMQPLEIQYLKDVKANGTNGGTSTLGSWQTRDLNTSEGDAIASVGSNQFTLTKGVYRIEASVPGYSLNRTRARLANITDGTFNYGDTSYGFNANNVSSKERVYAVINIGSAKTFEIQHRSEVTVATTGFGVASSFGSDEVYTQVKIERLR